MEDYTGTIVRMGEAADRATKKHAEEIAALTQANKRAYVRYVVLCCGLVMYRSPVLKLLQTVRHHSTVHVCATL